MPCLADIRFASFFLAETPLQTALLAVLPVCGGCFRKNALIILCAYSAAPCMGRDAVWLNQNNKARPEHFMCSDRASVCDDTLFSQWNDDAQFEPVVFCMDVCFAIVLRDGVADALETVAMIVAIGFGGDEFVALPAQAVLIVVLHKNVQQLAFL